MRKQVFKFLSRRRRTTRFSRYGSVIVRHLPGAWIVVDLRRRVILDGSIDFGKLLSKKRGEYIGISMDDLTGQGDGGTVWPGNLTRVLDMPGRHEDVALRTADGRQVFADVLISEPVRWNNRPVVYCWLVDRTELHALQLGLIDDYRRLRRETSAQDMPEAGEVACRQREKSTRSDSVAPS